MGENNVYLVYNLYTFIYVFEKIKVSTEIEFTEKSVKNHMPKLYNLAQKSVSRKIR